MTTNRRALHRGYRQPISPEALDIWRKLDRSHATRSDEYRILGKRLCGLIGLDWTEMQWPTDATTVDMPAALQHRPEQADAWRRARAARLALIEADAEAAREAAE